MPSHDKIGSVGLIEDYRPERCAVRIDRTLVDRRRRIGYRNHSLVHDLNDFARVQVYHGPEPLDRAIKQAHIAEREAGGLEQQPSSMCGDVIVSQRHGRAQHFVGRKSTSRESGDMLLVPGQDLAHDEELLH